VANLSGGKDYLQRVFFWDDAKQVMGQLEFDTTHSLHISKLKQRMMKIATD